MMGIGECGLRIGESRGVVEIYDPCQNEYLGGGGLGGISIRRSQ